MAPVFSTLSQIYMCCAHSCMASYVMHFKFQGRYAANVAFPVKPTDLSFEPRTEPSASPSSLYHCASCVLVSTFSGAGLGLSPRAKTAKHTKVRLPREADEGARVSAGLGGIERLSLGWPEYCKSRKLQGWQAPRSSPGHRAFTKADHITDAHAED